jgi:hypothetical protein
VTLSTTHTVGVFEVTVKGAEPTRFSFNDGCDVLVIAKSTAVEVSLSGAAYVAVAIVDSFTQVIERATEIGKLK